MATEWWCVPCRKWNPAHVCDCGVPSGAGANSHLYTASLNNHLYAQAESAERERKVGDALRRGYEPDPPKWAKKRAKQIVADL